MQDKETWCAGENLLFGFIFLHLIFCKCQGLVHGFPLAGCGVSFPLPLPVTLAPIDPPLKQ